MLHADQVDPAQVQEVGELTVLVEVVLGDLEAYAIRVVVAFDRCRSSPRSRHSVSGVSRATASQMSS